MLTVAIGVLLGAVGAVATLELPPPQADKRKVLTTENARVVDFDILNILLRIGICYGKQRQTLGYFTSGVATLPPATATGAASPTSPIFRSMIVTVVG